MLDLGFVVDAEAVPVILTAHVGGAYDADGKWIAASASPVTIMATVQPTSGRILRDLPEGVRDEARFTLWSRHTVVLDDVVSYDGRAFRVTYVWPRYEGGFTRAVLGLKKP